MSGVGIMADAPSRSEILQLAKQLDEQLKLHGLKIRMVNNHLFIDRIDEVNDGMTPEEFNKQLQEHNGYVAVVVNPERFVAVDDYRRLSDPKIRAEIIQTFIK